MSVSSEDAVAAEAQAPQASNRPVTLQEPIVRELPRLQAPLVSGKQWMRRIGLTNDYPQLPDLYDLLNAQQPIKYVDAIDPWSVPEGSQNNHEYESPNSAAGRAYWKKLTYKQWWRLFYQSRLPSDFRWSLTNGIADYIDRYVDQYRIMRYNQNGDIVGSSFDSKYLNGWATNARGQYVQRPFFTNNNTADELPVSLNIASGVVTTSDGIVYLSNKGKPTTKKKKRL